MKIMHSLLVLSLLVIASIWVYKDIQQVRNDAVLKASKNLELTRDIRIAQLTSDVKTMYSEIRFWADNKLLQEDVLEAFDSWYELSYAPKVVAKQLYVTDNPLYPNYTADYYNANDGSRYSEVHEKLHKLLKGLTKRRGYYDVFLVANNGDVIYSVYKEADFATNLVSGRFKESGLAKGFREVIDNTNLNHVSLFDFSPYEPSNNNPASFIQTSVIDSNNKTIGVLAFQLPVEPIYKILNNRSGLSQSTEILAVGSDYKQRNAVVNVSKAVKKSESIAFKSSAITQALAGNNGVEQLEDYKGLITISAYAPFQFSQNILGRTAKNIWAIVVKQNLQEILEPANQSLKKKYMWLTGLTLLSLLLAFLITNRKIDVSITEDEEVSVR